MRFRGRRVYILHLQRIIIGLGEANSGTARIRIFILKNSQNFLKKWTSEIH